MKPGPAHDLYAIRSFPTPAREGRYTKGWRSRFCCCFWKAREVRLETLYSTRRQRSRGSWKECSWGTEIGKRGKLVAKQKMRMNRPPEEILASKTLTALRCPHSVQSQWRDRPQEGALPRNDVRCLRGKYQSLESAPMSSQLLGVETTQA